jgi:hypothetical protein
MKKLLIIFPILINSIAIWSQTHTESLIVCNKSFTAKSELQTDNSIKIDITDDEDATKKVEFTVKTNDLELFASIFKKHFTEILDANVCTSAENEKLLSYGRKFFFNIVSANAQDTALPVAGILKIKDSVKLIKVSSRYILNGKAKKFKWTPFDGLSLKVQKIQVEINNGFIQNLKAYIQFPGGSEHYFILPFPVGVSSVGNFRTYYETDLINLESRLYPRRLSKNDPRFEQSKVKKLKAIKIDSSYKIPLSSIVDYDYYLGVDRRDYSPAPISITLMGGESIVLHKEETRKLFEAHIYTDFVGLQGDKPNGLVQVDVKKRININTRQKLSKEWIYWLFRSYGWLHYISPLVTFSKIEQHNRRLILGDLDSVRFNPGRNDSSSLNKNLHRFATPLDIYQHQSLSAGVDVNVFNLANHDAKYELALNIGTRLGITPLSDSLTSIDQGVISKTGFVNNYTLNTIQFYPEITTKFLPEERFNLSISNRFVYMLPFNPNIQMVSYSKNDNTVLKPVYTAWLNVLEMLMAIQLNPNSKLFGRLRYTYEMKNSKNNFAQIQVGYSTYILGNK